MDKDIIVYDRSLEKQDRNRINPELLQLIMLDDIQVTLTEIKKSIKRGEFEGEIDTRVLNADEKSRYLVLWHVFPYTPLIRAHFFNDGPDTVFLSLNGGWPEITLHKGEDTSVDFAHAKKRIELISYSCDTGETASIRVVGKY